MCHRTGSYERDAPDLVAAPYGHRELLVEVELQQAGRHDERRTDSRLPECVVQIGRIVDFRVQILYRPRRTAASGKDASVGQQQGGRMIETWLHRVGAERPAVGRRVPDLGGVR